MRSQKNIIKVTLFTLAFGLAGSANALAANADNRTLPQQQTHNGAMWLHMKQDASSTVIDLKEIREIDPIVDLDTRNIRIDVEDAPKLKPVRDVDYSNDLTLNIDIDRLEGGLIDQTFIGMPDRSDYEQDVIRRQKWSHDKRATIPEGRYVEPLYTVAGAGIKTKF
jgi:hypothetical protein